ncbi:MAG: glucose-1-phosphate adenylyltransferase [Clostridia bacterium]|nr:glucose-1-phosphate adenylyltransferase [Clostridia bacterium]MBQ3553462.1 glucose-1-phosphate adenylyltransferase [Clostridia bacterium]
MRKKKKCIAMLLAGGQGSRLGVLTKSIAKPAVPFGGKYRIIDFTLSNCVNSGIDTVGVLTQYKPMELNEYIGNGQPWGLDRNHGGVHILQPFTKIKSKEWYKGTANAIYQNLAFIERYEPKNVLVLSGDHIYKMDYEKMLYEHEKNDADCTIAVIDVPLSEASRFGIMNTDKDGRIYEFCEKPKEPKSTKASMGVYIFKTEVLKSYLQEDNKDEASDHDFGKNIIPNMLSCGKRMQAYSFSGYWKDVGTIESLWEANMDLLSGEDAPSLDDNDSRVYARDYNYPPTYFCAGSGVYDAMISKGCEIAGNVSHSIISGNCRIAEGARVENSVLFPGCTVGKNAHISYAILGSDVSIGEDARVGVMAQGKEAKKQKITVLGSKFKLENAQTVAAGEMLEAKK